MFTFGLFNMHLPYIVFFAISLFYVLSSTPIEKQSIQADCHSDHQISAHQTSAPSFEQAFFYNAFGEIQECSISKHYFVSIGYYLTDFVPEKKLTTFSIFNCPPPSLF